MQKMNGMMNRMGSAAWAVCLVLVLWCSPAVAATETAAAAEKPRVLAIELGAPFRDNAVLQRDMKVPVWGWSKPGATITVGVSLSIKAMGPCFISAAGQPSAWM